MRAWVRIGMGVFLLIVGAVSYVKSTDITSTIIFGGAGAVLIIGGAVSLRKS